MSCDFIHLDIWCFLFTFDLNVYMSYRQVDFLLFKTSCPLFLTVDACFLFNLNYLVTFVQIFVIRIVKKIAG